MPLIRDIQRTASFLSTHPLARQQPARTWLRWLQWQVRSRLVPGPHIVDWIGGTKLVVDRKMTGATGNLYCGLHEFADMAFVTHYLSGHPVRSNALFVDVGANVGTYTVLAAGVAAAKAIAIEPSPQTFARQIRNVQANRLSERVTLVMAACGDTKGEIRFSLDRDCENRVVEEDYLGASGVVPLRTLDEVLDGLSPTIIKLDVEGFEEQAICGASKVLLCPTLGAVLLEGTTDVCIQSLTRAGFTRSDYSPLARELVEVGEKTHLGNQLWLRDPVGTQAICKQAPMLVVYGTRL